MIFYFVRAADEGRKPRVADFGDKVEDSTFLNQLQNGVNRWIKEIQKVCVASTFNYILFCYNIFNVLFLLTGHQIRQRPIQWNSIARNFLLVKLREGSPQDPREEREY